MDPDDLNRDFFKGKSDSITMTRLLNVSYSVICKRLGYDLASQEYIESFWSVEEEDLILAPRPVTSLTGDGVWSPNGDTKDILIVDEDFILDNSDFCYIKRKMGWLTGFNSPWVQLQQFVDNQAPDWQVQFKAGYWLPMMTGIKPDEIDEIPADIQECVGIIAKNTVSSLPEGLKSFSKAGARVSMAQGLGAIPSVAESILQNYATPLVP